VSLNLTLPLRIHKRTEIRSDLEKEKKNGGEVAAIAKSKSESYEIIDRIESGYRRSDRLRRIDNRSHGPGA
jgi:hypothetical protein